MKLTDMRLAVLSSVTLLTVSITILVYTLNSPKPVPFESGNRLLAGFDPNQVYKIQIVSRHEDKRIDQVSLIRRENQFYVANISPAGGMYPASERTINTLFDLCMNIKCNSKITSNIDHFARFGVSANNIQEVIKPTNSSSAIPSVLIHFIDKNDEIIVGFVTGKPEIEASDFSDSVEQRFIRMVDSDQVYTINKQLIINGSIKHYLKDELIELKTSEINEVTVSMAEGNYTIKRTNDNNPKLQNIPEDKQAKVYEVRAVFEALTNLKFDNVLEISSPKIQDLKWNTYRCSLNTMFSEYIVNIAQKPINPSSPGNKSMPSESDSFYIKINMAEPLDTQLNQAVTKAHRTIDIAQSIATADKKKTEVEVQSLKNSAAQKLIRKYNQVMIKAQSYNTFHSTWAYEIGEWTGNRLCQPLDKLLEDKIVKEPEVVTDQP